MRAQWCSLRTGPRSSSTHQGASENEGKRRFRRSLLFVPCLVVNGIRAVLTLHSASPRPAPFSPCRPAFFPVFPVAHPFPFGIYPPVVRSRRKCAGRPPADGGSRRKNGSPAPAFSPGAATNTFPVPRILLEITNQFPSGNEIFFHESRRSMNLTAGICIIFRGLNFESNEESGEKSRFRTETCQPCRNPVSIVLRQEGGRLKCRAARHGMALSAEPERK
jgi:hypothetical protein